MFQRLILVACCLLVQFSVDSASIGSFPYPPPLVKNPNAVPFETYGPPTDTSSIFVPEQPASVSIIETPAPVAPVATVPQAGTVIQTVEYTGPEVVPIKPAEAYGPPEIPVPQPAPVEVIESAYKYPLEEAVAPVAAQYFPAPIVPPVHPAEVYGPPELVAVPQPTPVQIVESSYKYPLEDVQPVVVPAPVEIPAPPAPTPAPIQPAEVYGPPGFVAVPQPAPVEVIESSYKYPLEEAVAPIPAQYFPAPIVPPVNPSDVYGPPELVAVPQPAPVEVIESSYKYPLEQAVAPIPAQYFPAPIVPPVNPAEVYGPPELVASPEPTPVQTIETSYKYNLEEVQPAVVPTPSEVYGPPAPAPAPIQPAEVYVPSTFVPENPQPAPVVVESSYSYDLPQPAAVAPTLPIVPAVQPFEVYGLPKLVEPQQPAPVQIIETSYKFPLEVVVPQQPQAQEILPVPVPSPVQPAEVYGPPAIVHETPQPAPVAVESSYSFELPQPATITIEQPHTQTDAVIQTVEYNEPGLSPPAIIAPSFPPQSIVQTGAFGVPAGQLQVVPGVQFVPQQPNLQGFYPGGVPHQGNVIYVPCEFLLGGTAPETNVLPAPLAPVAPAPAVETVYKYDVPEYTPTVVVAPIAPNLVPQTPAIIENNKVVVEEPTPDIPSEKTYPYPPAGIVETTYPYPPAVVVEKSYPYPPAGVVEKTYPYPPAGVVEKTYPYPPAGVVEKTYPYPPKTPIVAY